MDLCRDHKIAKVDCWLTGCRRHFASSPRHANVTIVDSSIRNVKALLERANYRIQIFLIETILKRVSTFLTNITYSYSPGNALSWDIHYGYCSLGSGFLSGFLSGHSAFGAPACRGLTAEPSF